MAASGVGSARSQLAAQAPRQPVRCGWPPRPAACCMPPAQGGSAQAPQAGIRSGRANPEAGVRDLTRRPGSGEEPGDPRPPVVSGGKEWRRLRRSVTQSNFFIIFS